jgi:FKBP-type peptidyl-prolyl cis-trans isomerase FklB
MTEGSGDKPTPQSKVKVHYHGTLTDGTVFDSSVDRGEPTEFGVGQVIKGWTEGLQLMSVGSKFKFFIPQELAYGANPRPGGVIKPFMPLIFEVELLEIK